MDGELLKDLYHRLMNDPTLNRTRDCSYCDAMILFLHLAAVSDNRSGAWICRKGNWPICYRRLGFPSVSQFNRRVKEPAFQEQVERVNAQLRQHLPSTSDKIADGKPLAVGGFSHDPDAKRGKTPGGWAKGYKLHVIVDDGGAIDDWEVTALNAGESGALASMLQRLPAPSATPQASAPGPTRITLRADANYDSNSLYEQADKKRMRLIAPRRKPDTGLGHHPQHRDRLAAIELLERTSGAAADHKAMRNRVEQILAHLTNLPSGLWALPNFVRRIERVRRWLRAKLLLYHLHKVLTLPVAAAAA